MAFPDNQGRANAASQYLMEIIAQGRDDMKLLMGASSGEVFIGESGTELLGRLIRNATLRRAERRFSAVISSTRRPTALVVGGPRSPA